MSAHEKTHHHHHDRTLDRHASSSGGSSHKSRLSSSSASQFPPPLPPAGPSGHSHSHSHHHQQHHQHDLPGPSKPSTSAAAMATSPVAGPSSGDLSHRHRKSSSSSTPVSPTIAAHGLPMAESDALARHCRNVEDELKRLCENELRLKQQNAEVKRREHLLKRRLALKEQDLQDYANQIVEFKKAQVPAPAALRTALLDPAVNLLLQKLRAELQATRSRLEDTQNELSAWKFTPDSNTGKRLMAKCRLLYQENEELGRLTSNGRMAKLEGDLALQKSFSEEVKKSQSELDDFLQELDEDVEGMQSTILFLQQELKTSKDTILNLETEVRQLREAQSSASDTADAMANGAEGDVRADSESINAIAEDVQIDSAQADDAVAPEPVETPSNGCSAVPDETTNGKVLVAEQPTPNGKRTFDECEDDSAEEPVDGTLPSDVPADQQVPNVTVVSSKKIRRASVQSLNDDDAGDRTDDTRTIQLTACNGSGPVESVAGENALPPAAGNASGVV